MIVIATHFHAFPLSGISKRFSIFLFTLPRRESVSLFALSGLDVDGDGKVRHSEQKLSAIIPVFLSFVVQRELLAKVCEKRKENEFSQNTKIIEQLDPYNVELKTTWGEECALLS